MSTQVITTFDQDPNYDKVITVCRGEFTMEEWVATLSDAEQEEWWRQHDIHEAAVHAAVAAGDAEDGKSVIYDVKGLIELFKK